jgi:hypothetical protein
LPSRSNEASLSEEPGESFTVERRPSSNGASPEKGNAGGAEDKTHLESSTAVLESAADPEASPTGFIPGVTRITLTDSGAVGTKPTTIGIESQQTPERLASAGIPEKPKSREGPVLQREPSWLGLPPSLR